VQCCLVVTDIWGHLVRLVLWVLGELEHKFTWWNEEDSWVILTGSGGWIMQTGNNPLGAIHNLPTAPVLGRAWGPVGKRNVGCSIPTPTSQRGIENGWLEGGDKCHQRKKVGLNVVRLIWRANDICKRAKWNAWIKQVLIFYLLNLFIPITYHLVNDAVAETMICSIISILSFKHNSTVFSWAQCCAESRLHFSAILHAIASCLSCPVRY
jgi:hypothetical protein